MIVANNCRDMAEHVESLAAKHNVKIKYRTDWYCDIAGLGWYPGGQAHRDRSIVINTIRTPQLYCVAMHELGHVCHPKGFGKPRWAWEKNKDHLMVEWRAWTWAFTHCIKHYKSYMEEVSKFPLWTYYFGAKDYNRAMGYAHVYIPTNKKFRSLVTGEQPSID